MKKVYLILFFFLCCMSSLFAQAPDKFTYQAVVRSASNTLISNATVGVRVSILQGTASGNTVYAEVQTVSTNANGLLTLQIGDGNAVSGSFSTLDWSDGPYFLKTEIDPEGGSNYSITSIQQLLSVPYALYAKEAGNVPTNVGELTNDANYITLEDVPDIPTNVSAFTNDAGYITEASCNGMNICEIINRLATLQAQVDSLQESLLLPETYTVPPIVKTAAVTNITASSATCGGSVISDGGSLVSAKGVCWNTTGTPTISDNHTIDGGGMGVFESSMHGLVVGNTYYVRAYATNSIGTSYGPQVSFTIKVYQLWDGTGRNPNDALPCQGVATVSDHEGNVYNTVQIGNQCWTKENMRCTTSPSTGTTILEYPEGNRSYTGKKAYYVNGSADNASIFGLLYNWNAAVDTFNTAYGETSSNSNSNNSVDVTFSGHRRGICPAGWHVPSDAEWSQLQNYVSLQSDYTCGGESYNIAKALASQMWWESSAGSTVPALDCTIGYDLSTNNATGFSAVPVRLNIRMDFWSVNHYYFAENYYSGINKCPTVSKGYGASVRCLRD